MIDKMVEKKVVVDAVRFTYTGMFNMQEFFEEIDKWTDANEYERETKKKLEHVEEHGKKMEYIFELWKDTRDLVRSEIRLRALFRDVVDFDLVRGEHKRNMQKGHVLVIIDGFLETDFDNSWLTKPWFVFVRTLYDKLIWRVWLSKFDGPVVAGCKGLYNQLFSYFKRYKH